MRRIFHYAFEHSNIVITLTLAITLLFAFKASNIDIDPSAENLVPEHSKVAEMLEKYESDSSLSGYFLFAVESDNLFTLEGLQTLEKAITDIEKLPGITPGINPFSTMTFSNEGGRLAVHPLAPSGRAPRTEKELEQFKVNLIGNPFYSGSMISEDGTMLSTGFPCRPLTDEAAGFMKDYGEIKHKLESYFTVYTTGDVPISDRCNTYLLNDLGKLVLFAFLFMLASFYLGFKSKRSFLLPMSVVVMGTIWSVGLMSILGYKLNMISLIIPPLVLTIGSSYAIHILNQYYRESQPDRKDRKWIVDATLHVNKTIMFACLTTVIGFISLLFTPLDQTREFGIVTSFGIISCMLLTVFYMPAVLSKITPPTESQKENMRSGLFARLMGKLGLWVFKYKKVFIAVILAITILFIYLYPKIPSQSDYLSYFPEDDSVVNETSYITMKTGGYQVLNLSLHSPDNEPGFFLQPDILKKISDFELKMLEDDDIISVSSVAFFIRELNYLIKNEREIPESKGLINLLARYLKLIRAEDAGNTNLQKLANEDFSQITITFRIYNKERSIGLSEDSLRSLVNRVENKINLELTSLNPDLWSSDFRFLYLADLLNRGQVTSTIIAIIFVCFVSCLTFRSIKYALLTLLPLFTGLMLNFSFMAIMQIPLDMLTLMVSSIVIGVGVDDAIHYNIHFKKNLKLCCKIEKAIELTHMEAGRPILHTTISIVGGLLFLMLSNFLGIVYFGLLICFSLTFTMLGTLILLPAVIGTTFRNPCDSDKQLQPDKPDII